jgi:hypothetical protein
VKQDVTSNHDQDQDRAGVPHDPATASTKLHSIGLVLTHAQANLFIGLATRLRKAHGSSIHFYVRSESELSGMRKRLSDVEYDSLTNCERAYGAVVEAIPDKADLERRARALEARTGETINEIGVTHRNLGLGYSPGSFNHPRQKRYLSASYHAFLNAMVSQLEFWDAEIQEKRITLLFDAGKEASVMARLHGIQYRAFIDARLEARRVWGTNEYQSNPLALKHFHAMVNETHVSTLSGSYPATKAKSRAQSKRFSLSSYPGQVARLLFGLVMNRTIRRNRGYEATLGQAVLGPLKLILAARRVRKLCRTRLEDLGDMPFAYFALQKEPEQALLTAAPHHTDQRALIIDISRSLPAGAMLAVAEHAMAIGRRPPMFYEQILALPNVVLLDTTTDPLERIRRASVSITIAGSVAHEAGVLGKPAIVFGEHMGVAAVLPHVRVARSRAHLKEAIKYAFSGDHDEDAAKRLGARYEAAVRAASFDLGDLGANYTERNVRVNDFHVESAYRGLMATLDTDVVPSQSHNTPATVGD